MDIEPHKYFIVVKQNNEIPKSRSDAKKNINPDSDARINNKNREGVTRKASSPLSLSYHYRQAQYTLNILSIIV